MIPRARLKLQEQFEIVPGLDASTHRGGAFGRSAADGVTSVHRCTWGCAECSREDDVANELLVFERDPDNDLAHRADFVHHRGVVIREASLSLKSNSASPPGYLGRHFETELLVGPSRMQWLAVCARVLEC